MTVLFDAETGRLRLSADSWQALRLWGQGRSRDGERTAALHDAGVIERGRPHPSLVPALEAALEPVVTLAIEQRDNQGSRIDGTGWVVPGIAALLLDAPDELCELVTVHAAMLPSALARVVALGPRDRGATSPLHVPDGAMDRLLGADTGARRAVANELGKDRLPDIADGPWNHWSIRAQWAPDGQRTVTVLDTSRQMWLVVRPTPGVHTLCPTDPTQVWRLLTRLLPTDDEQT